MSTPESSARIPGYDFARAIAILGMIVHHFVLVGSNKIEPSKWLSCLLEFLDGRPASTFMILAGVGISLQSRRAVETRDPSVISQQRKSLIRRGVFLLLLGYLNLLVWPGDILRVYGISIILAAFLIDATNQRLIAVSSIFVSGFFVLLLLLDYQQNWDWTTLTYHGIWTWSGTVRNLFYDGFRAVFPWSGLLFFGMWLGRHDLSDPRRNRRCLKTGLIITLLCQTVSFYGLCSIPAGEQSEFRELLSLFLGTESIPPLPLFLLAACGASLVVISLSILVTTNWPDSIYIKSLVDTGQLALTWYFAHIYLGLGILVCCNLAGKLNIETSIAIGTGFFLIAVVLSRLWKLRFPYGPLESILRRLSQPTAL